VARDLLEEIAVLRVDALLQDVLLLEAEEPLLPS
jgi:hypothetical protein